MIPEKDPEQDHTLITDIVHLVHKHSGDGGPRMVPVACRVLMLLCGTWDLSKENFANMCETMKKEYRISDYKDV